MKKEGRNTSVKKSGRKSILIISATIFLALVGMISFFYIYFEKIYDVMLKKDMEQIEWTSYFVTKLIHEDIEHCVSGLQAGERIFHEYKEVGEERVMEYLREMKEELGFEKIGIVRENGKSIDDTGAIDAMAASEILKQVQASDCYVSNEIDVSDNMLVAVPIHKDGEVVGAIWGYYAISTIAEKIELTDDMHRYFQIIDDNGQYISKSGNIHSFAESMNLWDEMERYEFEDGVTVEQVRENVENGKKGYFHFSYQGQGRYVTYEPLGINNWYVFSVLVEDFLGDYVRDIEKIFTKLLIGLVICTVFVMSIIGRFIFRTMRTIKKQNQKLTVKNSLLSMILKNTNDTPFEINLDNHQMFLYHGNLEKEEMDYELVEDISPKRMVEKQLIRNKDYEKYRGLYEKILKREKILPIIMEIRIHGRWEWNRIHTFQIDEHYAIGFLEDYNEMICQNQKLNEIRKKTQIDHLTKLYSREYFIQEVEGNLRKGREEEGLQALFLLDLDYFKQVNDMLGHLSGDQVLQDTGIRLKSSIRRSDLAGRLGGDEFVLFIRNLPDLSAVRKCAEKINAALVYTYGHGEQSVTVSASIGVAVAQEEKTFRELYERADRALYEVKADKKNGYRIEGAGSAT